MPWLTKQMKPWFGMPFMTSSWEIESVLFLQCCSQHGAGKPGNCCSSIVYSTDALTDTKPQIIRSNNREMGWSSSLNIVQTFNRKPKLQHLPYRSIM